MSVHVAATELAQAFIEAGERVIDNDPQGRAVTTDLYAHSLTVATKHNLHPVRVLTAADDLIRGLRDHLRGPKLVRHPAYVPWVIGKKQWEDDT